jgi:hypothetical protein
MTFHLVHNLCLVLVFLHFGSHLQLFHQQENALQSVPHCAAAQHVLLDPIVVGVSKNKAV